MDDKTFEMHFITMIDICEVELDQGTIVTMIYQKDIYRGIKLYTDIDGLMDEATYNRLEEFVKAHTNDKLYFEGINSSYLKHLLSIRNKEDRYLCFLTGKHERIIDKIQPGAIMHYKCGIESHIDRYKENCHKILIGDLPYYHVNRENKSVLLTFNLIVDIKVEDNSSQTQNLLTPVDYTTELVQIKNKHNIYFDATTKFTFYLADEKNIEEYSCITLNNPNFFDQKNNFFIVKKNQCKTSSKSIRQIAGVTETSPLPVINNILTPTLEGYYMIAENLDFQGIILEKGLIFCVLKSARKPGEYIMYSKDIDYLFPYVKDIRKLKVKQCHSFLELDTEEVKYLRPINIHKRADVYRNLRSKMKLNESDHATFEFSPNILMSVIIHTKLEIGGCYLYLIHSVASKYHYFVAIDRLSQNVYPCDDKQRSDFIECITFNEVYLKKYLQFNVDDSVVYEFNKKERSGKIDYIIQIFEESKSCYIVGKLNQVFSQDDEMFEIFQFDNEFLIESKKLKPKTTLNSTVASQISIQSDTEIINRIYQVGVEMATNEFELPNELKDLEVQIEISKCKYNCKLRWHGLIENVKHVGFEADQPLLSQLVKKETYFPCDRSNALIIELERFYKMFPNLKPKEIVNEIEKKEETEEKMQVDDDSVENDDNNALLNTTVKIELGSKIINCVIKRVPQANSSKFYILESENPVNHKTSGICMSRYGCKKGYGICLSKTQFKEMLRNLDSSGYNESTINQQQVAAVQKEPQEEKINYCAPINIEDSIDLHHRGVTGRCKGIQGNINSCYMDSLFMAIFPFNSVFDYLLFRKRNHNDIKAYDAIINLLKNFIVNPLRTEKLYLDKKNMMAFRQKFEDISGVAGFTSKEKDPEEFLTILLTQLKSTPILELTRGDSITYSIIIDNQIEFDEPELEKVFKHALMETNEEFKNIPKCLILQIPRYTKTTRKFKSIYPNLEIDITNFMEKSPKKCTVCHKLAKFCCETCLFDVLEYKEKYFCEDHFNSGKNACKKQDHNIIGIKYRDNEQKYCEGNEIPTTSLNLFAVLCIETSHYVAFIKTGLNERAPWIFYDSMAERTNNDENIPHITEIDNFYNWIDGVESDYGNDKRKKKEQETLRQRLFSDGYLYFYQHIPSMHC